MARKVFFLFLQAVLYALLFWYSTIVPSHAFSADVPVDAQLEAGKHAIAGRTGCYLVDYSFVETDALKADYKQDHRVYDVNKEKSVKEWIFAEQLSPTRIKLQHVLFATDLAGKLKEGALLKHTGEDWEYDAPFRYEYAGQARWTVKRLNDMPHQWTRRVTSLDDGLRYQCTAAFNLSAAYPDWSCDNYAPIPGRETRDMGRKDYQGLQRSSRLILYTNSWLERERNVKTIESGDDRTPLSRELGKTWYVRLPDSECSDAQAFVKQHLPFWLLMTQTWDKVLTGDAPFKELKTSGQSSRYEKTLELEEQYLGQDLSNPAVRAAAQGALLKIIQESRDTPSSSTRSEGLSLDQR